MILISAGRSVNSFSYLTDHDSLPYNIHTFSLTCSKLVADRFEAKFHYTIWSQTGSKLVADLPQTC